MSKDPRKDALKKAWRAAEDKKLLESIPIPVGDLQSLFDCLDQMDPSSCDHTLSLTVDFLQKRKFKAEKVLPWLQEHGGFCDCEVMFNVEDRFGPLIRR